MHQVPQDVRAYGKAMLNSMPAGERELVKQQIFEKLAAMDPEALEAASKKLEAKQSDEIARMMATGMDREAHEARYKAAASAVPSTTVPQVSELDAEMLVGHRVKIVNLKAKPEHNEATGTVRTYDANKGRYGCQLDEAAGGKLLALRRINLVVLESQGTPDKQTPTLEQESGTKTAALDGNDFEGVKDFFRNLKSTFKQ
mmetsp:Transcript_4580/g.7733  ORF Transcript_4580/g.7733 Transcript_4580/m.7733 type:complete len:200 (+) Transcript_4580:87-686(+)